MNDLKKNTPHLSFTAPDATRFKMLPWQSIQSMPVTVHHAALILLQSFWGLDSSIAVTNFRFQSFSGGVYHVVGLKASFHESVQHVDIKQNSKTQTKQNHAKTYYVLAYLCNYSTKIHKDFSVTSMSSWPIDPKSPCENRRRFTHPGLILRRFFGHVCFTCLDHEGRTHYIRALKLWCLRCTSHWLILGFLFRICHLCLEPLDFSNETNSERMLRFQTGNPNRPVTANHLLISWFQDGMS